MEQGRERATDFTRFVRKIFSGNTDRLQGFLK